MPQLREPHADFAAIFAEPTIQRMLDELSDHEFEHFVGYVFEQAGYFVEDAAGRFGEGLDLRLYVGTASARALYGGISVKHFTPPNVLVNGQQMMNLHGAVGTNMQGYAVTTSKFNGPALAEARRNPPIWTINGEDFLRYITYVRGTRRSASASSAGQSSLRNGAGGFTPIAPDALLTADTIDRRASEVQVLTVANHKGGVGKTTTALNLAFGLASHGKQVLLVDMDAQANLTRALAYPVAQQAIPRYLDEYFAGAYTLADLVSPTKFAPIWLIPSRHQLIHEDRGLTGSGEAELQFARDLLSAQVAPPSAINGRPFDWIIMDTGPWMGFFTRSALAASRYVIVPIAPSVFADMGLEFIVETVSTVRALTGAPLDIMGCLVTQWRADALNRTLLVKAEDALALHRIPRIAPEIPLDKTNIERAHIETGQGRARNLFDRRCAAARAYSDVVNQILGTVAVQVIN